MLKKFKLMGGLAAVCLVAYLGITAFNYVEDVGETKAELAKTKAIADDRADSIAHLKEALTIERKERKRLAVLDAERRSRDRLVKKAADNVISKIKTISKKTKPDTDSACKDFYSCNMPIDAIAELRNAYYETYYKQGAEPDTNNRVVPRADIVLRNTAIIKHDYGAKTRRYKDRRRGFNGLRDNSHQSYNRVPIAASTNSPLA